MWSGKLRKVGGSVMVALPPEARQKLGLRPTHAVNVSVEGDGIVIRLGDGAGRIGLKARLAQSNFFAPRSSDEQAWLDAKPIGNERSEQPAPTSRAAAAKRVASRALSKKPALRGKSRAKR